MIFEDYFSELIELAHDSKEEVCGFLINNGQGSLQVYPTKNVSRGDKTKSFEIALSDQLQFYGTGAVEAFYHSHLSESEKFTDMDLNSTKAARIPALVYSCFSRQFNYYCPPEIKPAIEGRNFILGIRDCAQLVVDYYHTLFGWWLPFFARGPAMIEYGFSRWTQFLVPMGFSEIGLDDVQANDLLVMSVRADASRLNHAGVYLGDHRFLHQLWGRRSIIETFTPDWKRRVFNIFCPPKELKNA